MTEAGKRLLAAANEALAFAKGDADPRSYVVHDPPVTVDVKAIRKSMKMTQVAFGERFGFGKARVRDWEQERTRPTASDRVLLTTIKFAPEVVLEALAAEGSPNGRKPFASDKRRRVRDERPQPTEKPRPRRANTAVA